MVKLSRCAQWPRAVSRVGCAVRYAVTHIGRYFWPGQNQYFSKSTDIIDDHRTNFLVYRLARIQGAVRSYSRVFAYLRISVSTDTGTLALGD
jgi:hypothetical protein